MDKVKQFRLIMAGLIALAVGVTVYGFYAIPSTALVPIHWNAEFQADGWAERNSMLMGGLGFSLLMPLLYWLILKIEPRKQNLEASIKAYRYATLAIQAFLVGLYFVVVLNSAGLLIEMTFVLPMALGLLFIVLGNFMGKVRSNFMFGIRTPWTLSDDRVWNKTHRFGGRIFVGLGLLALGLAMFNQSDMLTVWLILVGISTLGIVFYSWWCFRNLEGDQSSN